MFFLFILLNSLGLYLFISSSFSTSLCPHSKRSELIELDLEIIITLRKVCHAIQLETASTELVVVIKMKGKGNDLPPSIMVNCTMENYARPSITRMQSSIAKPVVNANTFKIKPNIIQMVQNNVHFIGLPGWDPNTHIAHFLEACDTFKIYGISEDIIILFLSPFSPRDKA